MHPINIVTDAPVMAASQELRHPWILTSDRWDSLNKVYKTLHGRDSWISQYDSFIMFVIAFNAMANGQPLGVPVSTVRFYNRIISSEEAEYLFERQVQELNNPGSTGTGPGGLACAPLNAADRFTTVDFASL